MEKSLPRLLGCGRRIAALGKHRHYVNLYTDLFKCSGCNQMATDICVNNAYVCKRKVSNYIIQCSII